MYKFYTKNCFDTSFVFQLLQVKLWSWRTLMAPQPSEQSTLDTKLKVSHATWKSDVLWTAAQLWSDWSVWFCPGEDLQMVCGFSCEDLISMFKELKSLGVVVKELSNELRQLVREESRCLVAGCMRLPACLSLRVSVGQLPPCAVSACVHLSNTVRHWIFSC